MRQLGWQGVLPSFGRRHRGLTVKALCPDTNTKQTEGFIFTLRTVNSTPPPTAIKLR